jgi:hypothetical protein
MNHPESDMQRQFVAFVRQAYPSLLMTIAPINKTGIKEAVRNRAMGYMRGTPDVMIFCARGKWHGLMIEFKAEKGKQSEDQMRWEVALTMEGYRYEVCRSAMAGIGLLKYYLELKP